MIEQKVIDSIKDAKRQYDNALKTRTGVAYKKQILTNLLLNNADELLETALDAADLLKKLSKEKAVSAELKKQLEETPSDFEGESDCSDVPSEKSNKK